MFLLPSSALLSSRSLVICVALLGSLAVQDVFGCTDPGLYFIDKHYIKCIDLTTSNQTYVSIHTLKSDVVQGGAIDIHHQRRMIYWSDIALWTINRMSLDTNETEVIIRDNLGEIYGLAVEWESEKIYFTDFIFERIEVTNLNGSFRKTLISEGLFSPRGIAVDPKSGYMFWTDIGFDSPRIERADLTGENRRSLVSFGIDWYYAWFPMSVVVDYNHEPERIMWMDRYDNYIDYTDLDGNNTSNLGYIRQNIRPADLALYGDILYWADENSYSIQWLNMTQRINLFFNFGHLTDGQLSGIVVSDESRQPVAMNGTECSINNGGCSHLCLLAPGGGRKCACPNGVELLPGNKSCSNVTRPGPPPPPVPDLMVRLTGSDSSHEGRVEVYYNNKWGTICFDHWGVREADVVCKMLNFSGAFHTGYFGPGNESFPIWMDNVKCFGNEQTIAACHHRGWGNHDCSHNLDAGVVCRNDSIPPTEGPTLAPGPHPELKVRLQSGSTSNQGRVELLLNGTWGTICDDYWGIQEANVICRMLGYSEGAWSMHCCGWYDIFTAPEQIWLDNVHCVGEETSIAACRHGGWGSHNCGHSEDVGVVCKFTPPGVTGQKLRLADGQRQNEGRVEIFHDGYWGTVCDDFWDIKDAQVVCRQLGYHDAVAAPKRALFGEGNGHIWLRNVHCLGNESSVEDCEHAEWNANGYCFHFEDASVICNNETGSLDADDFLLFCESGRTLCHFMPLPQDSPAKVIPLKVQFEYAPTAISYDPKMNQIYWIDDYGNIFRAFLNNGSQEAVVRGAILSSPMGIEVDIIGRNVYFADNYGNNIRVASLDGSYQAILVDVQNPQGITLDSVDGHMYYSSLEDGLQIYRADMDGKNQTLLANLTSVGGQTHIDVVLDKPNNRLFFSDQTNEVIRYINLTSMEIHTILSGNLHKPTSLGIFKDTLYWTAEGDGTFSGAVFKANTTSNSVTAQTMADGLGTPKGIYAFNSMATEITVQSPCQDNGGCSHFCVLRPNGRTCVCGAGMKLAEDGITCIVGDVLFVADADHSELYISQFSDSILVPLPFSNIDSPTGVAFDPFKDRVYWTDSTLGIVSCATIDGKNQEIIRSGVTEPTGIDLDLVAENVYWINSGDRTIEVSKLNGDFWKVLVSDLASSPVDITLDTTRGFMYWSAEGVIERAELDGSNRRKVTELGVTFFGDTIDAKGLTLDVDNNQLYFVSYHLYSLLYIDLSSTQLRLRPVHTLIRQYRLFYGPYGIAVDDKYVYWSENIAYGYVFRRSKNVHDGDVRVVVSGTYKPKGIAVKKDNFTQNNHACADTCSHLCLLKPGGYKCACSVNESAIPCTESTNVTIIGCTEDPSLYFIDEHHIKCIELTASNQTYVSVKTLKSDLVQGGAIDVHYWGRMIYWSDIALWTINRMSLVTGETEVIIRDDLGEIYGLAVEWESEKIYFTDFIFERIEVANLDGTFRKTLITKDLYSPRGMAVDPKSGYMFWTDFGFDSPRIERADLTGENRRSLVSFGIDWYFAWFPMSVAVDYNHDPERIIWMDRYDNYIDYSDFEGNKGELTHTRQNIRPADLALFGDILYWADENSHSIEWFNMTQSIIFHYNYGHLTNGYLAGIVVSDKSRQPIAANHPPCRINNGGCSHLCLLAPSGGSKCACPNGVELLPGNKTCSNVTKPGPPPAPVPDLKVRLSGSNSSHEGRVEVYYDNKWGTVCDDHWGLREATIVCKMLNFSGAFHVGYFGPGNKSLPIWMDNVKCRGDEQSIAACRHRGWSKHDCSHDEDAGVVCRNDSIPPTEGPTLAPGPHPELQVRLRSGTSSNQGRVELFLNGTWGTICDDYWGIEEANVICRMLGYSEGAWSTHCCGWYEGVSAPGQIWLDDVHCDGDETSIAACRHGGWGSHNCGHNEDVGVICKYTPETPPGKQLRLADGVRNAEGRVEIFHDGYWGTVCDDYWDIKDAQVVCRELGYREAIAAPKRALFGEGNGHIWLSNVHCLGNESSIEDCKHAEWNANSYCFHFEDASVICYNETGSLDADDFVIFCESGRRLCHFMPLTQDSPAKVIPLKITFDYAPAAISYDPKDRQIYWTDDYGNIYRSYLNNGSQEAVVRGVNSPMGIEVDVIGRNVYFTDYSGNNIRVASLDGSYQAILVDVQNPQSIALDSVNGYMYYSSLGDSLQIYRADMDGKNQVLLANLSFVGDDTFVDLVLDKPNNRLFFSDQTNDVIRYINLANMGIHTILSGNLHKPTSIAMLNDTIYWTAEGDGTFSGAVFKANIMANSVTAMADGFGTPKGIYVYNSMANEITVQSPCQNNGGCSQSCVLRPNGRTCICGAGWKLAEDGISCTVGDVIFVADSYHDKLYFSELSENLLIPLPFSNIRRPNGIAFDPFEDRVYWTDNTLNVVYRSTIDGKNQEIIRSGVSEPMGIDLDLVARNVYWINGGDRTIEVSKLNGDYWKVLVSDLASSPVDITLDTTKGFMYWSAEGVIERAELDGSNRRVIAELGVTVYGTTIDARGLTLDVDTNRLYFVSYHLYSLLYIDLSSTQLQLLRVETLNKHFWYFYGPYGIAVDDQYVYWSEYMVYGYVFRTSKTLHDDNIDVLVRGTYYPQGIAVKKGNFTGDNHSCADSCSHLCLLKPGGYKCGCSVNGSATPCNESTHVTNVFGCTDDPSLYFIDEHYIKCIELTASNQTYVSVKTLKSDLVQGGAIDIHHRGRMIYWSDNALWTINRMSLVTGESEVIIRDDLGEIYGLAVEWESQKIYFTDFIFERIEVANLDGAFRKTLIRENLYSPRGIAVDSKSGYMFWTDIGFDSPRIERADLTGENRRSLVSFGIDWYYTWFPMSVVIDYNHDPERIIWMDRYDNYIDYADLNGNNKDNLAYIEENMRPVDVALYDDILYWADRNSRSIQWLNTTQSTGLHFNYGHLTDGQLAGVVVSDKSRQPVAVNHPPCRINNAGCSHLCLLTPGGGSKCACPNGVELLPGNKKCSNVTKPQPPPTPVPGLKVRLSGSNSSHEGRVEVYYDNKWGTICFDHWGLQEANVVCRMLNFSGAFHAGYFGAGNESFPIWMDNVKCFGNEQTIAACHHRGWGNHDCSHILDAGVVCRNDSIPPTEGPTLAPGPHPELKVRLRSGMTVNQGRVELFLNGTWGTICDDNWGIQEANVICRMLGYSEGAWSTHCCGWYDGFTAPEQIWLDDVHCDGDEISIAACRHGGWGSHNCGHSEDVGVVCKYTPETTGQKLRLADGVRKGEGRVEILHDGYWGTVCDDYWDIKDARVICRELGYPEAVAAPKEALFGEGNGHIWLRDVHCLGNESSIEHCEHAEWNANGYCYHSEDASVICSNYTGSFDAVDFVVFCESGRRLCHFVPLTHDSPAKVIPLKVTFDYAPAAISYDPKEKQIYWTDDYGNVHRAFLNNGSQEAVVRGVSSPMGIEVDAVGRNVYFTDYSGNNIRVASLDGSYQAILVDVQNPQSIALDNVNGYMYYSSLGDSPLIYRADMDGENQVLLANLSFAGDDTLVDLVLDKPNNRLFFSDQTNDVIRYINLANTEIHTILSGNLHNPTSLGMFKDTLYWTAEGDGTFSGAIFKANLTANSATAQTVADGFGKPKGIHVYSIEAEIPVQSACQDNEECSQLCILKPNGRTCKCGAGWSLAEDGTSCIVDDVIFVADVVHDEVYMSPLKEEILVPLPFSNIESPMGVAFDPFEKRVYWTDYTLGVVYRSTIDGKNQEIIRSNVTAPLGIDLDLVAGNVYWINSDDRTIEVSDFNGNYWKVLVYNLSSFPVDIALDTARGVMYWSAEGVIERAVMDGSNRSIIAELGVTIYGGYTVDARGLTLDKAMNRMYFVSFHEYSLFYIDLDSANYTVQTLIQSFWHFFLPYGIAVDEDYVYWTEHFAYGYVFRLNKTVNDGFVEAVIQGTYNPRGIAVKQGKFTRDTVHPCISGTSGCTHLCLKIPSGYKCDCPTVIEDAQDCSVSFVTWPPPPTTPTQPPATTSTTEAPTTVPPDYCASNPCENGATCKSITGTFSCNCKVYFAGRTCSLNYETEVVQLTVGITLEEYNETVLIDIIVESLNKECASNKDKPECSIGESLESIVKRAAAEGPFQPEDIKLPTEPIVVEGGIQVEYAVVRTATDGRPVAVPSKFVADVTEARAAEIGEKLGGEVLSVRQKPVEVTTTAPRTSGRNGGLIAGVVVAVLLIVIIAAIAVWYFRVKRFHSVNIPYVKEEENQSKTQTTAFENPGYDSTAAAVDYDDLGPVIFAPFEEHADASGVSNPIYTEIGMGSINPDGHAVESASENDNLAEAAGELPQKVPLGEREQLKAEEVEIVVQKEKDTTVSIDRPDQEEARYESLVSVKSKGAKNDQTEVTVEKEEEARYETLAHPDAGQTVLVLEGNSPSTAESQT